jgi:hypothetical protein
VTASSRFDMRTMTRGEKVRRKFVDAWNFFLPKEDHALMMMRA